MSVDMKKDLMIGGDEIIGDKKTTSDDLKQYGTSSSAM
jgi:hypothetical protein